MSIIYDGIQIHQFNTEDALPEDELPRIWNLSWWILEILRNLIGCLGGWKLNTDILLIGVYTSP